MSKHLLRGIKLNYFFFIPLQRVLQICHEVCNVSMQTGTYLSFCCPQYIFRNRLDRITISFSCHKNDRFGINI